jgi:predicted secreted acid phosphatase
MPEIKCFDKILYSDLLNYYERLKLQFIDISNKINSRNYHDNDIAIFDIDETCLVNLMYIYNDPNLFNFYDLYFNDKKFVNMFNFQNNLSPIVPHFKILYETIQQNNLKIFYITGRTTNWKLITQYNLSLFNIDNYIDIFFKPTNQLTSEYKKQIRNSLKSNGYNIVFSIGDQISDLDENNKFNFLLENPFYYLDKTL